MNTKGIAIAAAVAGLFATANAMPAFAAAKGGKIVCQGSNDCKGKSACKAVSNDCKGKNGCKGQGITKEASAKACEAKSGKVVKMDMKKKG